MACLWGVAGHDGRMFWCLESIVRLMSGLRMFGLLLVMGVLVADASPRRSVRDGGLVLSGGQSWLGPVYYERGADERVLRSAEDLGELLGRITGREWPVLEEPRDEVVAEGVFVGRTTAAYAAGVTLAGPESLPPTDGAGRLAQAQRFRLAVTGRRVLIVGAEPESTATAVYYFLQRYVGVRWYIPGELGEELPAGTRVRLPEMDRTVLPSFYSRTVLSGGNDADQRLWQRRNFQTPRWRFNHNLHRVLTPDLFEENPELFSVIGGRLTPTSGGKGPNPNLVNPAVSDLVAEAAAAFFQENPEAESFSISVTDNVNFDESPATLEVVTPFRYFRSRPDYSDLVFGFSNRVAERLWPLDDGGGIRFDEVPDYLQDKYLGALAYYWAEQVPSFPVHPRIIPYLTSDRGQWFSPAYREEDKALIRAWCAAGPELVGTWDYYEGGPYFIPRTFTENIAASIPFMHKAGVRAFYAEGRARWGFDAPRLWLASQLLIDARQDPGALLRSFYQGYFRESAKPMQRFYEECERVWMAQPEPAVWLKFWLMPGQAELFPPEVWERLEGYLRAAEAGADSERVRERIALVREDFDFSRAGVELYWAWKKAFGEPDNTVALAALAEARERFAELAQPPSLGRFRIKEGLLDIAKAPVREAPPAGARVVLSEGFEVELVPGDTLPTGPLPFRAGLLRDGWRSSSFHNDTFVVQRRGDAAVEGDFGLRVEGATYFSLFQWLAGEPGDSVDLRLRYRGQVSVGSRFVLTIIGMSREGKLWSHAREAEVPPGQYPEWRELVERTVLPEGTAWYSVGFRFNQQMEGDYMELDDLRVTVWRDDT